jgi:hypothetical protein
VLIAMACAARVSAQPPAQPQPPTQEPQPPQQPPQEPTAPVPPGATGAGGPAGSLPVYGGASAASKIFNPDIAVIGNFLGAIGENSIEPAPVLSMHESEISLQAIVDPYARADFFVAFGEEGAELEEGFITFPTLPGGLLMRAGRIRASFGKLNPLHNHVVPWTDRPIVINNLLGGEEGIGDAGISLAVLVPNPWLFLEATGQVFRGEAGEGEIFHTSERSDVAVVGRLRGYQDITESTNVDLGVSFARGHNSAGLIDDVDVGRFVTGLIGVDATVRWKPLQRSIYRSFVARTEAVWSRREQFDARQDAMGFFVSADYQLSRRWFAGVRYDRSDRADDAEATDTGQSVTLTFWPSEFNQIRTQYRRTNYAQGETANELLFQFQFSIGAHGAHPF